MRKRSKNIDFGGKNMTQQELDRFAYRQGLFVIGQTGETVKILNDKTFKPKIW